MNLILHKEDSRFFFFLSAYEIDQRAIKATGIRLIGQKEG